MMSMSVARGMEVLLYIVWKKRGVEPEDAHNSKVIDTESWSLFLFFSDSVVCFAEILGEMRAEMMLLRSER